MQNIFDGQILGLRLFKVTGVCVFVQLTPVLSGVTYWYAGGGWLENFLAMFGLVGLQYHSHGYFICAKGLFGPSGHPFIEWDEAR